ncbi:MAG: formylglycine-generating enzyme family protein [Phycisphaerales bacterium]|nr:MAG: formylglycine-generating enzyme family protein [Phycisphaerales bacterium]
MTRSAILACFLTIAILPGCRKTDADAEPEEESPPEIAFTQERLASEDVIYLRNKEELRGRVIESSLSVSTPYGELSIAADRCARVAFFEDEKNKNTWIEVIITLNGNRITGTNTEPTIRFRDSSSGEETEVQKEGIWFIAFREDSDELSFIDVETPADQFIMANGDLLTGRAAEAELLIQTDSGEVPITFVEIASIRLPREPEGKADEDEETESDTDESTETVPENMTAFVRKRNKDVVSGTLVTEKLTLNLDVGVTIEGIARDQFARIYTGVGEAVTNSIGMELVPIPAGEFTMGSPADEERRDDDETQRRVSLTSAFHMSATEVTQGEWFSVMGEVPSEFPEEFTGEFTGGLLPVENVSWEEAIAFCNGLSTAEGLPVAYEVKEVDDVITVSFLDAQGQTTTDITQVRGYRLPTEAEWEYACRAGTTTVFNTGDTISTDQANYDGEETYGGGPRGLKLKQTVPVGCYQPNGWGLYDMHGNVWELCFDLYGDYSAEAVTDPTGATPGASRIPRSARVLRGGGWSGGPEFCRSAYRAWISPTSGDRYLGFRVVRNED